MTPEMPEWLRKRLEGLPSAERAEQEREWREMAEAVRDHDTLRDLDRLNGLIRDRVAGVARRYQTAAYIVGRAGTGKTHTVRDALDALGDDCRWVYRNARMSPAALFEVFQEHADSVVVIDDVPLLFREPQAVQLLLAAVGGDPGRPRPITYSTKGDHRRAEFRGGLVAISNLPLKTDPLAAAVRSRAVVLSHEPTDEMLVAQMRQLAGRGYKGLTPAECREVVEFLVGEAREGDHRIDLRHYGKAVEDFLFCKENAAHSDWRSLVRSSLRTFAPAGSQRPGRAEQIEAERKVAAELLAKYPNPTPAQTEERNREWMRRTGKSPHSYYRRVREMGN